MNTHYNRDGFTIIEVLLFLAISSLLAVALLGGWTLAVNTQSYKDSLTSLSSELQQQFSEVNNVTNDRSASYVCDGSIGDETTVAPKDDGGTSRGATDCVIMGRYVYADGAHFVMSPIVGTEPGNPPNGLQSDQSVIAAYKPTRLNVEGLPSDKYDIPWSARPYAPHDGDTLRFAMVIIRSPASGVAYTYIASLSSDGSQIPGVKEVMTNNIWNDPDNSKNWTICLAPGGPVVMGNTAIVINRDASSQSDIDQLGDGENNQC